MEAIKHLNFNIKTNIILRKDEKIEYCVEEESFSKMIRSLSFLILLEDKEIRVRKVKVIDDSNKVGMVDAFE